MSFILQYEVMQCLILHALYQHVQYAVVFFEISRLHGMQANLL